jgi:glucose-1-phosphate thymidylyltransferase
MKGVILAGGYGTRLKPFTNVNNKGMAPIYTKEAAIPQIIFPLKTLTDSGINEILITSSREHCGDIIEFLGDGEEYGCHLTYRVQEMNRPITGIAQALKLAEPFVNEQKFAVILGDNYYQQSFDQEVTDFENDEGNLCYLFLKEVNDPKRFGVATVNDKGAILEIEEKPMRPKSKLAVTGLYFYTPDVFDIIKDLKPSGRNELEITDVNNHYVDNRCARGIILESHWQDMGVPKSAMSLSRYLSK